MAFYLLDSREPLEVFEEVVTWLVSCLWNITDIYIVSVKNEWFGHIYENYKSFIYKRSGKSESRDKKG